MSSLRPLVRSAITNLLTSQEGYHLKTDILRIIEEEAGLMKETQDVLDMLDIDPMEQLTDIKSQIEKFKKCLQVTSCSRVRAGRDYCRIHAVISFEQSQNLQLTFCYQRNRYEDDQPGCHVRYSIEMSKNHRQKENLIVVEVWAPNSVPSSQRAVSIDQVLNNNDDEEDVEDGWEDIEEDAEDSDANIPDQNDTSNIIVSDDSQTSDAQKQGSAKRQKIGGNLNDSHHADNKQTQDQSDQTGRLAQDKVEKEENEDSRKKNLQLSDKYFAYLNPDLLHEFVEQTGLKGVHDGTAFFLLMTFPFYEHEWDLVGYLLDEIFGYGDDEEDKEGEQ